MAADAGQEQVIGSLKAPTWAMGAILAALLGGGVIIGVTSPGSHATPAPQPSAHDAAIAAQVQATSAVLTRIESKIDVQAAEIATVRESVAEIRGQLKAAATPRR